MCVTCCGRLASGRADGACLRIYYYYYCTQALSRTRFTRTTTGGSATETREPSLFVQAGLGGGGGGGGRTACGVRFARRSPPAESFAVSTVRGAPVGPRAELLGNVADDGGAERAFSAIRDRRCLIIEGKNTVSGSLSAPRRPTTA